MTARVLARLTRNILFWLAIVGTPGAPAMGQEGAGACAAIAGDTERLACYDAIFRPDGGGTGTEPVVVDSERMIPGRPTGRAPATMTVSCEPEGVGVAFGFAGQLVSNTGDIAPVTFQVDQNATAVRTLRADASNTSLSFAAGEEAAAFLDSLAGGTNLKVRMTPVRQRSVTVDFRLSDVAEEIEAIQRSCG